MQIILHLLWMNELMKVVLCHFQYIFKLYRNSNLHWEEMKVNSPFRHTLA